MSTRIPSWSAPRLRARAGTSLIETVAAMTLSSFVLAVIAGICVAQMRLARVTAARAVVTESARTVSTVLAGEARRMIGADVIASSHDSIAIRAFRGLGLPCGVTSTGVLVRYTGDRMPDATKDSVLIVTSPVETAAALQQSVPAPGQCPSQPGEVILEWRTGHGLPLTAVFLAFESGSYHLSTGAFRYRTGAGGRQPLTAEVLRHPGSRFMGVSPQSIRFQLEADGMRSEHSAAFPFTTAEP